MLLAQSEDEKKKQLEQQDTLFGSQTIGAGGGAEIKPSGAGPSGATSGTSRLSPVSQSSPQSFGTIQDYFKGSREQGERFGEQFTGKLGETQQQTRSDIGQAAFGAGQDITAGTLKADPNIISSAAADPTKVASDEDQFNQFLKQWTAAYKGPSSFEGSQQYGAAAKAAQTASERAAQLGTTGGRQQLIQEEFGVYGQGKKGLDEALLQQSSYFPKIGEQAKGFRSIQDYLASQSADIGRQAQQAKETTTQTRQQAQAPFEGRLTKFKTGLETRTAAAQEKARNVLAKYQSNLAGADPTAIAADLREAGVDDATAKSIIDSISALKGDYGLGADVPGSYFRNIGTDINPSTVATAEDYERAAALQKLTGVDYGGVLNPADIEKAGTGGAQQAFKSGKLQTYLKDKLGIQDKSFLKQSQSLPRDGASSKRMMEQYISAATRQDTLPKDEADLAKMMPGLAKLHTESAQIIQQYNTSGAWSGTGKLQAAMGIRDGVGRLLNTQAVGKPVPPPPVKTPQQIKDQIDLFTKEMNLIAGQQPGKQTDRAVDLYKEEIKKLQKELGTDYAPTTQPTADPIPQVNPGVTLPVSPPTPPPQPVSQTNRVVQLYQREIDKLRAQPQTLQIQNQIKQYTDQMNLIAKQQPAIPKDVVRSFYGGGMVGSPSLQDYLKREKR